MGEPTQGIRPVSKMVNEVLGTGALPSGPFNFGLYFNKWMFVIDGRFMEGSSSGKGWACCGSDETKTVRNRQKMCDPNLLLDNFDNTICLFNNQKVYSRKMPIMRRNRDGSVSYSEDDGPISISKMWERGKAISLLKAKHASHISCSAAYRKQGYEMKTFRAYLLSSLVIGLGNDHPTEKGFLFDWTLGVPYLPASGIKGMVRLAYLVNRLNEMDKSEAEGFWKRITNGVLDADAERIFGCEEMPKEGQQGRRGQIVFLDAYPEELPFLAPEIMNCHYKDYLNSRPEDPNHRGPSEDQQPNPQKYWAVSPWLDDHCTKPLHFVFRVLVPKELAEDEFYERFRAAFEDALSTHGLGAKTAVGHGHFSIVSSGKIGDSQEEAFSLGENNSPASGETDAPVATLSEEPKAAVPEPTIEVWENVMLTRDPGSGTITATYEDDEGKKSAETRDRSVIAVSVPQTLFTKKKNKAKALKVSVEKRGVRYYAILKAE